MLNDLCKVIQNLFRSDFKELKFDSVEMTVYIWFSL